MDDPPKSTPHSEDPPSGAGDRTESATEGSLRRLHDAGVLSDADFASRMAEARSRPGLSTGSPAAHPSGPAEPSPAPPEATTPNRWVCLRCFSANDDSNGTCATCGLARGATPEAQGWAAQPPARSRSGWGSIVRRFGWLAVVGVLAAGGAIFAAQRNDAGEITKGGNLAIEDVRIGDCFNLKDVHAEETSEVDAKRCGEAHQFEMVFAGEMRSGEYPTEAEISDFVASACGPAFDDYVGMAYADSHLEVFYWFPVTEGWNRGDRGVQCAVYDPLDNALLGSLRGAKR